MLEQRKRAVTHGKRMQNYNQQNAQRRQTTHETRKQNAFVLYDLKNIEMLQADSESSDGGEDHQYAFDFSDEEEQEIQQERKEKKVSKQEQDKNA